ncbi:MAG: RNA polymerase sigma factor [Planctomycetota bacterium]
MAGPSDELVDRIAALLGLAADSEDPSVGRPDLSRDEHVDELAGRLLQHFRERDDSQAFALLVELTQPRLSRLARLITRQIGLAVDSEDLVAGFFARIFVDTRKRQPYVARFVGLARTAMRNDALGQLRQYKRAAARHEIWGRRRLSEPGSDPAHSAEQAEQDARLPRLGTLFLAVVGQCFHELAERERRVLLAREVDKLSYDGIAEDMSLPRGQVGMIVKRARERLRLRIDATFSRLGQPHPLLEEPRVAVESPSRHHEARSAP